MAFAEVISIADEMSTSAATERCVVAVKPEVVGKGHEGFQNGVDGSGRAEGGWWMDVDGWVAGGNGYADVA